MEPLKDNQPWRRCLSVVLGAAFVIWALVAIYKGHITAGRNPPHTFFAAKEPVGFWATVSVIIVLGVVCVYRGVKGKEDV